MVRGPRKSVENGWYHVMNRGQSRRGIFLNQRHFHLFMHLLNYIKEAYNFKIAAYCVMSNHYHLLINTPHDNLSEGMQYLNSNYAMGFNKDRKRDGAVFKGRFKSILIETNRYLTQVSRYIHLNPVEANILIKPELYPWSSCAAYLQKDSSLFKLDNELVLELISDYSTYLYRGNSMKISDIYSKSLLPAVLN